MGYDSFRSGVGAADSEAPAPFGTKELEMPFAAFAAALLASIGAAPPSADALAAAAYPGARAKFEREVAGKSIRIRYRCYVTGDTLAKVAAYYEKDPRFAPARWKREPGERAFALRSDPELHVHVFPAANAELHKQCEMTLGPEDRTLLQISQSSAVAGG